jgi:hypothetical protein
MRRRPARSPAGLPYTGQVAVVRELAQPDAGHAERPQVTTRPTVDDVPVAQRRSVTIESHSNMPQPGSRHASLSRAATSSAEGGSGSCRSKAGGSARAASLMPR